MRRRLLAVVLLVLTAALGLVAQAQEGGFDPLPTSEAYAPNMDELALDQVYESVVTSVVNITVAGNDAPLGTGSGFVIDTNGHIVTNNHVVEGAEYIEVTFYDGSTYPARLIGRDPDSDLAVVQVDPNLPGIMTQPVQFANSADVFVGQNVMAIGSPFGQNFSLTTGIVSALNRNLAGVNGFSIPEVIQTDAAINPGNSGGPLLNYSGAVIGVNTAILSASRTGSGVGFAVPANTVRRVVPYLIADGEYRHSYLGIAGAPLSPSQREAMNLPREVNGVVVASVVEGGPGAEAGLEAAAGTVSTPFGDQPIDGDIITAIENTPVQGMNDLIAYLEANTLPGDTVTLSVWRGSDLIEVPVTLSERPRNINPQQES